MKTKHKDEKTDIGLKKAIERLINSDNDTKIELLEDIYHKDMQIILIDSQGEKSLFNKTAFIEFITVNLETLNKEKNKWVQFQHLHTNGNQGHIVLKRRNELMGVHNELDLSIDFMYKDGRWQITREVIFTKHI